MANKTVTVEVDADVKKAKGKIGTLAAPIGTTAPSADTADVGAAAEKTARSLNRATQSIDNLGARSKEASINVSAAVKSFAGMGIGLAMSYAASNMESGSGSRRAIEYGGSAIQMASMGSIAGPIGAAAGAILGIAKQFIGEQAAAKAAEKAEQDAVKARYAALESQSEQIKKTREWKELTDQLTNSESSLVERQRQLQEEIKKREEAELRLRGGLTGEAGIGGDPQNFTRLMQERAKNASEIDQLKALQKALAREAEKKSASASKPADYTALDALARVGGSFATADSGFRNLQRVNEKQVALLEKIERKTGNGKGVF